MQTVTQTFAIKGMHCASCANIITRTFKKISGVMDAEVNYGTETAKISFDQTHLTSQQLSKSIEPFGYSLILKPSEGQTKFSSLADLKTKVISLIPLATISIFIMGWDTLIQFHVLSEMPLVWKEFFHHLLPLFSTYALFVAGTPYLLGVYRFFRYGKANMDTLIGLGTSVAFIYSFVVSAFEKILSPFINVEQSYYDVTIVVIAFITIGKYLESKSKIKTGGAIEKLLHLQAKTALVLRHEKEIEIPLADVQPGEIIIVKSASKIPVDGEVIDGESYVDESMVTGEPMPVQKQSGDIVVAGTLNTSGSFRFRATKVGSETMLASIIKMVQEAQGTKAPIQALADKISAVFVPVVLVLSFVALGFWLFLGTRHLGFSTALSHGLVSFVGILVIACPCALGLATPTAIIVGVGKGAREGILVKDASTLEKLHTVTTVVVDKTGTLTKGKPEVVSIKCTGDISEKEMMSIFASLESRSEHPIASALTLYAKENMIPLLSLSNFEMIKGKGIKGIINATEYCAGNIKMLEEMHLSFDTTVLEQETKEGKTPVILATKEKVLGIVMVADALKNNGKEAVQKLHALGIKVVMLTGDTINTARFIANQVGIDEVFAEVLPSDKLKKIKELQSAGQKVAMAGDGVNDAPALAQADVGIAMATGTDVAIASAGITLLRGDLSKLVAAIRLSKSTMRGIKQNLFWAFIYNIVGIPLAGGLFFPVFGWLLNPIFAGAAMAMSSVSVVLNSLRLKNIKL